MADYEVLAPGGHARLVSDVKSYADRAGGKGTTQLADGSVTRDKLADGVTDRIDAMHDRCDPLVGNHFFGELAEGTVLTADDAYAAPPESVSVFGKSTQAGTPTPDAPVPILSVDDLTLHVCGFNVWDEQWEVGQISVTTGENIGGSAVRSKNYISVIQGVAYCVKVGAPSSYWIAVLAYDDDKHFISNLGGVTNGSVFTPPSNCKYVRFYTTSSYGVTYSNDICINVSDPSRNGTYAPYVGTSVSIPLSNHYARSLPDGTRDTLTLTYQAPSTEHEGWGVYSKTLVQRVDTLTLDGTQPLALAGWRASETSIGFGYAANTLPITTNALLSSKLRASLYDDLYYSRVDSGMTHGTAPAYSLFVRVPYPELTTVALTNAWLAENPITIQYALAESVVHDLGTVELPVLPNPMTAWTDGGSAQPTMSMNYEQDINIVIARLEAAIADLATA